MQLKAHAVSVSIGMASGLFALFSMAGRPQAEMPAEWEEILEHMSIVYLDDGNGGQAKTIRISEVNVQLVNGSGGTQGNPFLSTVGSELPTNSVGNLIVGYNEPQPQGGLRTGSHNLIVGSGNNYSGIGGAAIGQGHSIADAYCSTLGGSNSSAAGYATTVSGGTSGKTSGLHTHVAGGAFNEAHGSQTAVFGGWRNIAHEGVASSIHGGEENEIRGVRQVILGGVANRQDAASTYTTIVGGQENTVEDAHGSLILGGQRNSVFGDNAAVYNCLWTDFTGDNVIAHGIRFGGSNESSNVWIATDCLECSHE